MRVFLSTLGSRENVEPRVEIAVQVGLFAADARVSR